MVGKETFRSISPGWIGRISFFLVFEMLTRYFASVIIRNFDIVGIAVDEPEADSPLVVDGNRALSFSVFPELVQSISRRNPQVTSLQSEKARARKSR